MIKRLLSLALLLTFCSALYSQGFSSLYSDLDELDWILERQRTTQELQRTLLADLREQLAISDESSAISEQKISDLESISWAQSQYLSLLQEQLKQAELIRQAQLNYQKGLGLELKTWKIGTITLGVTSLGLLIWGLTR